MIRGVGVDLVRIERVELSLARFGERLLQRVLGEAERGFCLQRKRLAEQIAVRFAAKEAFMKAVGLGLSGGLRWRDIEVIPDERGAPVMRLSGRAAELCRDRGATPYVSLAHEAGLAMATVVLDGEGR